MYNTPQGYQTIVPNPNLYETIAIHKEIIRSELTDLNDSTPLINDHGFYFMKCGHINFNFYNYDISDPNAEFYMSTISWPISQKYIQFFKGNLLSRFFSVTCSLLEFESYLDDLDEKECIEFFKNNPIHLQKFEGKGLHNHEIKMMLYAIRFYTGGLSTINNRELAYDIKETFLMKNQAVPLSQEFFIINSYFLKGLNYLPIYWGYCTRCLNLTPEEMEQYAPGNILTWFQFSSSTRGQLPHPEFTNRSVQFIIYSISGREVSDISKYKGEREVIFLPFSQFLVFKYEMYLGKPTFFMRQIELGIGKNNVLWVDENIFDTQFGYKQFIEYTIENRPLVRFILKTSNNAAQAYLESLWGDYQKNDPASFRIICNDYCKTDDPPEGSGVRFLNIAISLGFTCKMMIFSYNINYTWSLLQYYGISDRGIMITNSEADIVNFITFSI